VKILSFERRRNAVARAERADILRQRRLFVTRFFQLVFEDEHMDQVRFCQLLVRIARRQGRYQIADVRAAMALLEPGPQPDYGRGPMQQELSLEDGGPGDRDLEDRRS
jgi:hypothetical protein